MDFFLTSPARRGQGAGRPPDRRCRPDGALLGASATGRRDALLTFIGPELVAVRGAQFRDGISPTRGAGRSGWAARTACRGRGAACADGEFRHPAFPHIESDPREEHNIGSVIRVGNRTDVEGCGGLQGQPPEISESAGGEFDALVIDLWMGAPALALPKTTTVRLLAVQDRVTDPPCRRHRIPAVQVCSRAAPNWRMSRAADSSPASVWSIRARPGRNRRQNFCWRSYQSHWRRRWAVCRPLRRRTRPSPTSW